MKRVLLTGATGFVGSHCIEPLLARDYEIHAVSTRDVEAQDGIVWHQADLLEPAHIEALLRQIAPTHLLHLAWFVAPGEYWTSPMNFRWVEASLKLLEAFAANGGVRAVFVGTGAEYGDHTGSCVEGKTPLHPTTIYGTCKAALGIMLPTFSAQFGISSAWARLFYLYGPHEKPSRLVPSAIRTLLNDQLYACSFGDLVRDYLYIQDAADALVALLDSHVTGEINVGSGEGVSLNHILSCIGEQLARGHLLRFETKSASVAQSPAQVADVTRLTSEVGWTRCIPLEQGVKQTIEWWKKHGV